MRNMLLKSLLVVASLGTFMNCVAADTADTAELQQMETKAEPQLASAEGEATTKKQKAKRHHKKHSAKKNKAKEQSKDEAKPESKDEAKPETKADEHKTPDEQMDK